MEFIFGYFNTDAVNRLNHKIPCDVIARGLEEHALEAIEDGFPIGVPMHVAHDMHHPIGWAESTGLLLTGDLVAQVGFIGLAESDEENAEVRQVQKAYLERKAERGSESSRPFLEETLRSVLGSERLEFRDAAVGYRKGIAADIYPDLFKSGSELVDKDGLTFYSALLKRFDVVHPGVFRDRDRGLLIFAHRFFRRSLSHLNNLNDYFLGEFQRYFRSAPELDFRLRLDPDVVGDANAYKGRFEYEYWGGPKFDDDISRIAPGVTVHSAGDVTRALENVDLTHFWWKGEEARKDASGKKQIYRTLEVEELIVGPSLGIANDAFGCRYVHSEYDVDRSAITHFDGAIRMYRGDSYELRKQARIDRAGKHSDYTKLFRIDGPISVTDWKGLVAAFFRGNVLVPEYLEPPVANAASDAVDALDVKAPIPDPLILISLADAARADKSKGVSADRTVRWGVRIVPFVEFIEGSALGSYLKTRTERAPISLAEFHDAIFNFPRITLVNPPTADHLKDELRALKRAVDLDVDAGLISEMSFSISWRWKTLLVTVSASGSFPGQIPALIDAVAACVDPAEPPSKWVASLKQALGSLGGDTCGVDVVSGRVLRSGILQIPHPAGQGVGGIPFSMTIVGVDQADAD